ncbi:MAG: rhomboid family intramembrane serine protease [Planctomycetes bacterium]|nr:rhomboid family intramembrane serine protease [Planctomycetota bacterium]
MFLPIGLDYPYYRRPYATAGLIVANIVAFGLQAALPEAVVDELALWPDRFAPWQWLTAVFLHGGMLHLAGNMLFLWVYGRFAEERLGPGRFVALYCALGVAASLVYIVSEFLSGGGRPAWGASGAISGLMGVALVAAHSINVRVLLVWHWHGRVFEVPAIALIGVWVAEQSVLALAGVQGIAVSAHLGGFAAGVLAAWLLSRERMRASLWYLDPALASAARRKERQEAAMWGAIAEYHGSRSKPAQVTPGWQPPKAPRPEVVDPYEHQTLQRWNKT